MRQRGFLVVLALLLIPVCFLAVATLIGLVVHDNRFALHQRDDASLYCLAESGLQVAYNAFRRSNFQQVTLGAGGAPVPPPADPRGPLEIDPSVARYDASRGEYVWSWRPGDPGAPMVGHFQPQEFRVRVGMPEAALWKIECTARLGTLSRTHRMQGSLQSAFDFLTFVDGDSDYNAAVDGSVRGKVHINGTAEMRPNSGARIDFFLAPGDTLTAVGGFMRADGHPTSTVFIDGVEMVGGPTGTAMESAHPDWTSTTLGAPALWGGRVRDGQLGARRLDPPAVGTLDPPDPTDPSDPGGYYYRNATVRIDAAFTSTWCTDVSFFNRGEGRLVAVKEIDVAAMLAASDGPANNLVYSEMPVRLRNAHILARPLTVACLSTIYLQGDYNKRYQNGTDVDNNIQRQQHAGLITRDRIWYLTRGFTDSAVNPPGPPPGSEPPLFPGDTPDELEVNAAIVNGKLPDDGVGGTPTLEDNAGITFQFRGAVAALQNARMAASDNSNAAPGVTAWVVGGPRLVGGAYLAPDPRYSPFYGVPAARLGTYDARVVQAPFFPRVARLTMWEGR